MNIIEQFESKSNQIEYSPHKTFKGVYLKHLIIGKMTNNRISCHLVKVEPFCSLEMHNHPEQLEIHEVIWGSGDCQIADEQIRYTIGSVEIIPQNVMHTVTAGNDGLYILAKFTPALL